MLGLSYEQIASAIVAWLATSPQTNKEHAPHHGTPSWCPDYNDYSQEPHPPYSSGPLRLPHMRPEPACRTFKSIAVEVRFCCDLSGSLLKDSVESHNGHG